MDDYQRLDARQLARAKAHSRRRRISLIRQRTIGGSLALFAIAWTIIFSQLALGSDPALSSKSKSSRGPGDATTAQAAAPPVAVESESVTASVPPSTSMPVVTASS